MCAHKQVLGGTGGEVEIKLLYSSSLRWLHFECACVLWRGRRGYKYGKVAKVQPLVSVTHTHSQSNDDAHDDNDIQDDLNDKG